MNTQAAFLAAAIQQPLLILDSRLRCVVANMAFCVWFGGRPELHAGVPLERLADGAFAAPDVLHGLAAALHNQAPYGGLTVRAGQTVLTVQACPMVLKDEPVLAVVLEAQSSATRHTTFSGDFEALWKLLGAGPYLFVELSGNGTILRVSVGVERLTGWTPEMWVGRNVQGLIHPDDVVLFYSPQVMFEGSWLNVVRLMTQSGEYRRFEVCTYPLIGPNGNLERIFGIGRDLTEYFIHMDRRKDAESEARALFAAMDGIVLILARDGRIMRVLSVPERLLPWRTDKDNQIGGVKIEDVLSPFVSPGNTVRIEAALTAGKPLRFEVEYPLGDEKRWFSAAYSPLDEERVLLVADDITERKQAERQALELALTQERTGVLERLIADVSHDLRHPVSVLRSASIVMEQYIGQAQRQVNDLYEHAMAGRTGPVRNQVMNFGQILANMREQIVRLDNSLQGIQSSVEARIYEVRAERGVGFEIGPHALNLLIDQAAAIRRADALRRGQSLMLALESDLPPIHLDAGEFSRALRTLIGRALQDAPDNATVIVSTRREGEAVIVEVAGPVSIDPHELARLTNPEYRAMRLGDQWQSSHDLTIAHRIVVAHGGKVGQDTRPGGVRVWQVWLPVGDAPGETREA